MAETLTESFCERCGTRYEFKAPTRLNPLRKTRGLVGGLRNYLTSQDALSDAIGDAMRSEEDGLASAQLEAFHESFNFCIDCRQYTCVNCWNDDAGRCRSCVPIPGTDDLAERLAASFAAPTVADGPPPVLMDDELQRRLGLESWPMSDLPVNGAGANGHEVEGWPEVEFPRAEEPEPTYAEVEPEPLVADAEPTYAEVEPEPEPVMAEVEVEPEPVMAEVEVEPEPEPVMAEVEVEPEPVMAEFEPPIVEFEPEPEPVAAVDIEPEPAVVAELEAEPEPVVAELEPEPVVAEVEPEPVAGEIEIEPVRQPLRVVAWDEDAAFELIQEEATPFVEAEVEPEPVVAEVEVEPEPVVAEVEPEPVVAEVEPEPEALTRRMPPISETILHFPTRPELPPAEDERTAAAAEADGPELAARRAQLDLLGIGDPGEGPVTPGQAQPLPYRSRGAAVSQAELARAAALRGSFWEASAREVASAGAQVGVQSCGQCGLSLSANARFCRRCGTRQARSA